MDDKDDSISNELNQENEKNQKNKNPCASYSMEYGWCQEISFPNTTPRHYTGGIYCPYPITFFSTGNKMFDCSNYQMQMQFVATGHFGGRK